jgi:pyruvate,water dikinase
VAENTNPEWVPVIKRAAGIVTRIGARTSHVSRTARELGVLAVVGCGEAIDQLQDGTTVTLLCTDGLLGAVYEGHIEASAALSEADAVSIRHVSEAFTMARSCRPRRVQLDLSDMLTAFRLPPPGAATRTLTPRLRRRIAGYPSVESFVHGKLVEATCLVAVAFPDSHIVLSLPAKSAWQPLLPRVAQACRQEHDVLIEVRAR